MTACLQIYLNLPLRLVILVIIHAGGIEHAHGRFHRRRIFIFIRAVNDLLDPALDDRLGAFIAGEKRHVKLRPLKASAPVIQDRVQFAVHGIKIFRFQRVLSLSRPRKIVVRAARGKTVVSHGQNLIVLAYDTASHLRIRIF